jgi:hypothetical protein
MSAKNLDDDFDELQSRIKKTQANQLAQESIKRLAKLFNIVDITPSRAYEDTLPSFLFDLWHILTALCNKFPTVLGGMLSLEDVININKYTSPFELEVILITYLI